MSNPLKEIAEAILALTYAEITELAKGIGDITVDDEAVRSLSQAAGGDEKIRDCLFYWAESEAAS